MDDLVDLLDSDEDITPKIHSNIHNDNALYEHHQQEQHQQQQQQQQYQKSLLNRNDLRKNVADPLDPKNWEAYSPKHENEIKDAFEDLNVPVERKPPPPPKQHHHHHAEEGHLRAAARTTANNNNNNNNHNENSTHANNNKTAEPSQQTMKRVVSKAETIIQRTIRYPEHDMIAPQLNIPNPGISSPPRPSSMEKNHNMKPTSSFMKLSIEENPTPQTIPPPIYGDQGNIGEKHVLVMVGLPARGKTHMAKRLCQYLRFFHGANTKVFNVGEYRRKVYGAGTMTHVLFDSQHEKEREVLARAAMKDMIDFLFQEDSVSYLEQRGADSGRVAIFDATNSTKARRQWLVDQMGPLPVKLLFVESVCNDEDIITNNIWDAKVSNADYVSSEDKQAAYDDFRQRIREYERRYETMDEDNLSFIKLIDCGKRVEINRIHGYLLGRIVQFLSNLHAHTTSIYLTRHGQSEYNSSGKIGGDSCLTVMGEAYAKRLAEYASEVIGREDGTDKQRPVRLWTSSLQRTQLTARHIPHPKILTNDGKIFTQMAPRVLRNLDEIYAGVCDGMTYEEIKEMYPEEYVLRQENKLGYRYPRGESYLDVISRLDPLIQELESYREPVVIVGHQGVLRLIYAYFVGLDRTSASQGVIPLNTIIKLTPRTHDCIEERICLYNPAEDDPGIADSDATSSYASIADPPSY